MQRWQWTGPGTVAGDRVARPAPGAGRSAPARARGGDLRDGSPHHRRCNLAPPAPSPLGHEISGEIVAIGPASMTASSARGAASIRSSSAGAVRRVAPATATLRRGVELGVTTAGAWQEYLVVPERNCYPIPDHVSLAAASQAEPLHVVLGALDRVEPRPGEAALVIGDGATRLYFARLLRAIGCRPVTLVGRRPERLSLARSWGVER